MDTRPERPKRSDASRNRLRLLEAADALIATQGLDISFNALARHAGVGVGTVYRNFTDKDDLLGALVTRRLDTAVLIWQRAADAADPVTALREAMMTLCEHQAADLGVWQAVTRPDLGQAREAFRPQVETIVTRLVSRARATGRIRPEFSAADVPIILWTGGAIAQHTADVDPGAWRRIVSALLDGFGIGESCES